MEKRKESERGGKTRTPYPAEYRQQILELYASGRSVTELSKEFGCSGQTLHNGIRQAGPLSKLPEGGAKVIRTHGQAREVAPATARNAQERAEPKGHAVRTMARVRGVSASGYYDWCDRGASDRDQENEALSKRIREIHAASGGLYGRPPIVRERHDRDDPAFDERGSRVSPNRVARLMRAAGLQGGCRRRGFAVTTQRDRRDAVAPDLVKRQFMAEGPDQLWVSDITYVPTWAGFISLAIVRDAWSASCWIGASSRDVSRPTPLPSHP